jgi:hypothetical protein
MEKGKGMDMDNDTDRADVLQELEVSLFGPRVKVVRTLYTGDTVEEMMPASIAVDSVLRDPINGNGEVVSAHIEWNEVTDVWGVSM